MRSLDIGASGMLAQQINVDVISNNIANMNTTGYKRQRANFQDLIYQNITRPGTTTSDVGSIVPAGIQLGLGVGTAAVTRIVEQGPLRITENPLDLAITGDGYFQIQLPNGETAYTRDGSFSVNDTGEIVNAQGYLLDPGLTIPDDAVDIEINPQGQVFVKVQGEVDLTEVGQIQLATFINPVGLDALGDNLFLETQASGTPSTGSPGTDQFGTVRQGSIEQSNVNVVEEITTLITAQRAYEMNSNVISTSDEMMQTASQLR